MPHIPSSPAPGLEAARVAVRSYMASNALTQVELARQCKVPQAQISKFLSGRRKRWTPAIRRVCQYAGIAAGEDAKTLLPQASPNQLSRLLRQIVGDDARAAGLAVSVLQALAPVFAAVRSQTDAHRDPP